jgi:hypothetical protein
MDNPLSGLRDVLITFYIWKITFQASLFGCVLILMFPLFRKKIDVEYWSIFISLRMSNKNIGS